MQVRFRLRTVLLAVALVAFAGAGVRWGVAMRHRSRAYQTDAIYHDLSQQIATFRLDDDLFPKRKQEAARKSAAWHAKRRDIYLEAASRPWRHVPPVAEPKSR
ncbi:hypothetical protein V5E97_07015 [Singulisphaera sp. Ch08]|uniref:Uncharacterized protein n=1 Tax=Singulisphaera sp. Ch08 TaxID=3120278 RepID=A0AAU7CKI6_9BACT